MKPQSPLDPKPKLFQVADKCLVSWPCFFVSCSFMVDEGPSMFLHSGGCKMPEMTLVCLLLDFDLPRPCFYAVRLSRFPKCFKIARFSWVFLVFLSRPGRFSRLLNFHEFSRYFGSNAATKEAPDCAQASEATAANLDKYINMYI